LTGFYSQKTGTYFDQLIQSLSPELFFGFIITAILAYLGWGLHMATNKFILAYQARVWVTRAVVALVVFYTVLSSAKEFLFFHGCISVGGGTSFLKLLVVLSTLFILVNLNAHFSESRRALVEFPLALGLALLFILLLISAADLFFAFLAIVGFSLNLYILIFFNASESAAAREGGIKYFYLSTFSSGLMIYGVFLLFLTFGSANLQTIEQIKPSPAEVKLIGLGVSFILIGLFFKLSAFPGHLWAAEVYDGIADPVLAFFMLPVKVGVLAFVIQILAAFSSSAYDVYHPLLLAAALGSLLWGCLGALVELKTKRFLAYASINQIGFLLIGLLTDTVGGYRSTLLYLLLYIIMTVVFLAVFLNARRSDGLSLIYLTDFRRLPSVN
jgi:NADH-quinone oxidoreductase subunit N